MTVFINTYVENSCALRGARRVKAKCLIPLIIETKKYSRVSAVEVIREKYERKRRTQRKGIGTEETGVGNSKEKVGHGGARVEAEMRCRARGE